MLENKTTIENDQWQKGQRSPERNDKGWSTTMAYRNFIDIIKRGPVARSVEVHERLHMRSMHEMMVVIMIEITDVA